MISAQLHPAELAKCPWCSEEVQVALPLLEPPPESVRITRAGALFESTWLARLIEEGRCPVCRKDIKIWWYGGYREQ